MTIREGLEKSMNRIVDLSLTLKAGMRGVEFEQATTVARDGWNTRMLHLYSHCGTHMDAPWHFEAGDRTIDQIPLQDCMGPAWVVDVTSIKPKGLIHVADLGSVCDTFRSGDTLLLKTGWSKHVGEPDYYRNNFPRVSEELARWCVQIGSRMLGVEPPSVADVNDIQEVTRIHKILLGGNVTIVEGLTNLDALRDDRVFFAATPLRIEGGDGSPARAFAVEGQLAAGAW